jgi:hypothetical protein
MKRKQKGKKEKENKQRKKKKTKKSKKGKRKNKENNPALLLGQPSSSSKKLCARASTCNGRVERQIGIALFGFLGAGAGGP